MSGFGFGLEWSEGESIFPGSGLRDISNLLQGPLVASWMRRQVYSTRTARMGADCLDNLCTVLCLVQLEHHGALMTTLVKRGPEWKLLQSVMCLADEFSGPPTATSTSNYAYSADTSLFSLLMLLVPPSILPLSFFRPLPSKAATRTEQWFGGRPFFHGLATALADPWWPLCG